MSNDSIPQPVQPSPQQSAAIPPQGARLLIRRAHAADSMAIRDLTRSAYARWVPMIGREPKPMTADYDEALRSHLIDLLYVDDALAALIEMIPAEDHLLIENVAVLPEHQGHGLGHQLMAHAESVAQELGLSEMRLYTNSLFEKNITLYRSLGYQVVREESLPMALVIHMSKPL